MGYDFHPAAQRELQDAVDYYDAISPELGDVFLDEWNGRWNEALIFQMLGRNCLLIQDVAAWSDFPAELLIKIEAIASWWLR